MPRDHKIFAHENALRELQQIQKGAVKSSVQLISQLPGPVHM